MHPVKNGAAAPTLNLPLVKTIKQDQPYFRPKIC